MQKYSSKQTEMFLMKFLSNEKDLFTPTDLGSQLYDVSYQCEIHMFVMLRLFANIKMAKEKKCPSLSRGIFAFFVGSSMVFAAIK